MCWHGPGGDDEEEGWMMMNYYYKYILSQVITEIGVTACHSLTGRSKLQTIKETTALTIRQIEFWFSNKLVLRNTSVRTKQQEQVI